MPSKSALTIGLLAAALSTPIAGPVAAQQPAAAPAPNPLDTVPEKMPFDVPYGAAITLDRAEPAIAAAVAEAKKRDWRQRCGVIALALTVTAIRNVKPGPKRKRMWDSKGMYLEVQPETGGVSPTASVASPNCCLSEPCQL